MASNFWRRNPSFRLSSGNLVNSTGGKSSLLADDFFEYVAPVNASPNRISVGAQGPAFSVTCPTVVAGDVLVVYGIRDGGPIESPGSAAFTVIKSIYHDADGEPYIVAYHVCTGTESGTSLTFSLSFEFYYIVEVWRNVDPVTPIGASDSYVSSPPASGAVTPIPTTLPALTTTVSNSVVVAAYAGDVYDDAATYTFTTPAGFGGKFLQQESYNAHCVFNKLKVDAGSSPGPTSDINTSARMGVTFVLNAMASSTVNVRAIVSTSNKWQEITDAQLGTGLKPLVLYNGAWSERVASEGVPLVISGTKIREKASSETLLI